MTTNRAASYPPDAPQQRCGEAQCISKLQHHSKTEQERAVRCDIAREESMQLEVI